MPSTFVLIDLRYLATQVPTLFTTGCSLMWDCYAFRHLVHTDGVLSCYAQPTHNYYYIIIYLRGFVELIVFTFRSLRSVKSAFVL